MGAITTEIQADSGSCRAGADYFDRLAEANEQAATAAYRTRSTSESGWSGEASDAFREYVDRNAQAVDELVRVCHLAARALRSFADDIDTCRHRMQTARDTATGAGLLITGPWIHEPVQATSLPEDPKTPALPGLNPDGAEEQERAWDEANALVTWARELERTAHGDLGSQLTEANAAFASLENPMLWIGNAMSYAGALHGAATTLQAEAAAQFTFVKAYQQWAATASDMPADMRLTQLAAMLERYGIKQNAARSNARALGNLGNSKLGNTILTPLSKTFGDGRGGILGRAGKMGSVAGLVLTGLQSAEEILIEGEPVDKTISTNAQSWAIGGTATGGALLAAEIAGISGGPVTIAAVGVGGLVTWGYNYLQDHSTEDLKHDIGAEDREKDDTDKLVARFGPQAEEW